MSPRCPGSAGGSSTLRLCPRPRASLPFSSPSSSALTDGLSGEVQHTSPRPLPLPQTRQSHLTVRPSSASIPDHGREAGPHTQAGSPERTRHAASPTLCPHARGVHGAPALSSAPTRTWPTSPSHCGGQGWRWGTNSFHLQLLLDTWGGGGFPSTSRTPRRPSWDPRASAQGVYALVSDFLAEAQPQELAAGAPRGGGEGRCAGGGGCGGRSWASNWAHGGLRGFILAMALTEGKGSWEDLGFCEVEAAGEQLLPGIVSPSTADARAGGAEERPLGEPCPRELGQIMEMVKASHGSSPHGSPPALRPAPSHQTHISSSRQSSTGPMRSTRTFPDLSPLPGNEVPQSGPTARCPGAGHPALETGEREGPHSRWRPHWHPRGTLAGLSDGQA